MIKVVAFDLDDTLWALRPVIMHAEEELSAWLKAELPELQYDSQTLGKIRQEVISQEPSLAHRLTELRRQVIEYVLLQSDIPPDDAYRLSQAGMEVFLSARNEIEFFDGALEAIAKLAQRYQLGALTNGNADIQRLGLAQHFSFAFSAEEVGAPKPAPALFHAALAHTECQPGEMVYVGDDPIKDIDPAKRLGLHTVWFKNDKRIEGETSPDRTISRLSDLPEVLLDLDSELRQKDEKHR